MLMLFLMACDDAALHTTPLPREAGERAPLSATCDEADPIRCLLPWPSSTFTVVDDTTETGVRLDVAATDILGGEDVGSLNRADGFSRVSSAMTGFYGRLDPASAAGAIRILNAQPGHPDYGADVPVRAEVVSDAPGSLAPSDLLLAHPLGPMASGADHVVVVTDALVALEGAPPAADRWTKVALGLAEPASADESVVAAYHAPTRALLEEAGVDPGAVVRVWDFTTRSEADVTDRLASMIAAVDDASLSFTVDAVEPGDGAAVDAVVRGTLAGVPLFIEGDRLTVDDEWMPVAVGTRTVPVRAVLPVGGGRPVLYGHGLGGDINDGTFDGDFAAGGAMKVNLQFDGWEGVELVDTFAAVVSGITRAERVTARHMQSLTNAAAVFAALDTELADAIEAEGFPRPIEAPGFYVGGSLGGISGAVLLPAVDGLDCGVLNVPGAGWGQLARDSSYYDTVLEALVLGTYSNRFEARRALVMAQNLLDEMDGASWGDVSDDLLLLQESVDDPVVPNTATGVLANGREAVHIGEVLVEHGREAVPGPVTSGAVLTQYKTEGSPFAVHGFGGGGSEAGYAARDQIFHLLQTLWDGEPEVRLPDACVDNGSSCDFTRR